MKRFLCTQNRRVVKLYDIKDPIPYLTAWDIQKKYSKIQQDDSNNMNLMMNAFDNNNDIILLLEHKNV